MIGIHRRKELRTSSLGWMVLCTLAGAGCADDAFASVRTGLANDGWPYMARAERSAIRQRVRQRLAAAGVFAVGNVRGAAGTAIPISVTLPSLKSTDFSLLTIRGLPKTFSLSSGFRFEDSWAVSLVDVEGLVMHAPFGYAGRFDLEIQLIKGLEQVPEKLTIPVEIKPGSEAEPTVASVRTQPGLAGVGPLPGSGDRNVISGSAGQAPAKVTAREEAAMMERGGRLLQIGDISAARMVFERLARRGSSQGAHAAGRTYDVEFLASLKVVGITPSPAKAKEWYKRAADLGDREAAKRLSAAPRP